MASTFAPIATTTLSSATTIVTFTSISQSFTDLVVVANGTAPSAMQIRMRFNNNTSAVYSSTVLGGGGTSASSAYTNQNASITGIPIDYFASFNTSGGINTTNIMNYSNTTTNKTVLFRAGIGNNGVTAGAGLFASTSAISRIDIISADGSTNMSIGTTITIYGIAAA